MVEELIDWCGKRYSRDAFPDSFNRRLNKNKKSLRKIMKEVSSKIIDVRVRLHTENELSLNEPYKIVLRFLAEKDISNSEKEESEKILSKFVNIVEAGEEIEVIDSAILATDHITLDEFSEQKHLDFDDLSSF